MSHSAMSAPAIPQRPPRSITQSKLQPYLQGASQEAKSAKEEPSIPPSTNAVFQLNRERAESLQKAKQRPCPPPPTAPGVRTVLGSDGELWEEYHTDEGYPYWFNAKTNVTTWYNPMVKENAETSSNSHPLEKTTSTSIDLQTAKKRPPPKAPHEVSSEYAKDASIVQESTSPTMVRARNNTIPVQSYEENPQSTSQTNPFKSKIRIDSKLPLDALHMKRKNRVPPNPPPTSETPREKYNSFYKNKVKRRSSSLESLFTDVNSQRISRRIESSKRILHPPPNLQFKIEPRTTVRIAKEQKSLLEQSLTEEEKQEFKRKQIEKYNSQTQLIEETKQEESEEDAAVVQNCLLRAQIQMLKRTIVTAMTENASLEKKSLELENYIRSLNEERAALAEMYKEVARKKGLPTDLPHFSSSEPAPSKTPSIFASLAVVK